MKKVASIIEGKVLVGHAIENDLQVNIGGTCYRERLTGKYWWDML